MEFRKGIRKNRQKNNKLQYKFRYFCLIARILCKPFHQQIDQAYFMNDFLILIFLTHISILTSSKVTFPSLPSLKSPKMKSSVIS